MLSPKKIGEKTKSTVRDVTGIVKDAIPSRSSSDTEHDSPASQSEDADDDSARSEVQSESGSGSESESDSGLSIPSVKPDFDGGIRSRLPSLPSRPSVSMPSIGLVSGIHARYRDSSIITKTLISISIILVAAVIIGGFFMVETQSVLQTTTANEMKQTATLQNNQIDLWLNTMNRQSQFIANSGTLTTGTEKAIDLYLQQQLQNLPSEVAAVHYVAQSSDGERTVVASTYNKFEDQKASELNVAWADVTQKQLRQTDTAVNTAPYKTPIMSNDAMAFVTEVPGQSASVVMTVNLAEASRMLSAPRAGQAFVVNGDKTVVLSTTPSNIGKKATMLSVWESKMWDTARTETSGTFTTTKFLTDIGSGESKYVASVVHVEEPNWVATTQQKQSVAYSVWHTIQTYLTTLIVTGLIVMFFAASIVIVPIVRGIRRLAREAEIISQGEYEHSIETDRDDEIGSVFKSVERMRLSQKNKIDEVEEISDNLAADADEHTAIIEEAADGDLTVRMNEDARTDQMRSVAKHFNKMMTDIQQVVQEAKEFGYEVSAASEEATHGIREVRSASDEVTSATQEISDGAAEQDEKLDETVEEMENLSGTVEEVAASAKQVAQQAEETERATESGREAAEDAIDALDTIEDQTDDAVETVEDLNREAQQISEVVSQIQDIAEQTNMLATNARIEAANAGEAGEGFAVVADRVKDLANDAAKAADEVEDKLETFKSKTEYTAEDIEEARETVEEGGDTIEDALEELDEIGDAVDETVDGVHEIDSATKEQAETAEDVMTKVEDVATISKETASQAEEVAAASEEQTASIVQVSESTNQLAERATQLSDLLNEFDAGVDKNPEDIENPEMDATLDADVDFDE